MRHLPSILRRPVLNRNSSGSRLLFASMLTHLPVALRGSRIGRRTIQCAGRVVASPFVGQHASRNGAGLPVLCVGRHQPDLARAISRPSCRIWIGEWIDWDEAAWRGALKEIRDAGVSRLRLSTAAMPAASASIGCTPYRGWPGKTAISGATSPHATALRVADNSSPTPPRISKNADPHQRRVPQKIGRHDPPIRRDVKNGSDHHGHPLRRGQDSQTGHG